MESKFTRYWKQIDLFGVAPVLSFQGKGKQKSYFGGFFSILMFAYILLAAYYSFQNMVFRLNPNTNITTDIGKSKGIKIGKNSLNVGFSFGNSYTGQYGNDLSLIQPQFFKFYLPQVDPKTGKIIQLPKMEPLATEKCTTEHFNGLFNIDGYCMGINEEPEIGIAEHEVLLIRFNKCNNATSTVTCKPQQEIDNLLNNYQVLVTYPGMYIDPNNFETPVTIKREYFVIRASATLSKQIRVPLQEVDFETDTGFIIQDKSLKSYISVERLWADITDDGKAELSAIVYMNGRKQIYQRTYMKIQQALAGTISLIRVAFLICAIFVVPCTKVKYYMELINELFSYKNKISYERRMSRVAPLFELKNLQKVDFKSDSTNLGHNLKLQSHTNKRNQDELGLAQSNNASLLNNTNFSNKGQARSKTRNQSAFQLESIMIDQTPKTLVEQFDDVAKDNEKISDIVRDSTSPKNYSESQNDNQQQQQPIIEKILEDEQNINSNESNEKHNSQDIIQQQQSPKRREPQSPSKSGRENSLLIQLPKDIDSGRNSPTQSAFRKDLKLNQNIIDNDYDSSSSSPIKLKQKEFSSQPFAKVQRAMTHNLKSQSQQKAADLGKFALVAWFQNALPGFKNEQKASFMAGKEKISNELCVTRIMKKMRELDRLKVLLLDETQRVVFDNLPKPGILAPQDIPNALERQLTDSGNVLNREDLEDGARMYIEKLASKQSKTNIDKKLLAWYKTGEY